MTRLRGIATEAIPVGATVLCRGFRVSRAAPEIANGVAGEIPPIARRASYEPGDYVSVDPIDGLGARDLHAMANAPLMDASQIFLPAGKLSMDEYRARVAADVRRWPVDPDGEIS